jgi:hypothetical protein
VPTVLGATAGVVLSTVAVTGIVDALTPDDDEVTSSTTTTTTEVVAVATTTPPVTTEVPATTAPPPPTTPPTTSAPPTTPAPSTTTAPPPPTTEVTNDDYPLQLGSVGPNVTDVQEFLLEVGYDLGPWGADGHFGPDTEAAVRRFQADNRDEVTGVVEAGSCLATCLRD